MWVYNLCGLLSSVEAAVIQIHDIAEIDSKIILSFLVLIFKQDADKLVSVECHRLS